MENFRQQFEELLKKNGLSKEDAIDLLRQSAREEDKLKIRKQCEENGKLVGKCFVRTHIGENSKMFPSMKGYIKVISGRSENAYRVECLVFPEHPTYWFEYVAHRSGFPGDYYLGSFDLESIKTESIMVKDFESYEEISEEEYNAAMNKYIEELQKTEWICDHHRFGEVMPTDKKWKRK